MKVTTYLREKGITSLCETFAIKATRHREFPNLVHLKYNQIDSPMGEPIVQECRGLILDEEDDWRIVAHPYHKFFNHGEGHAPQIDWSSARVHEKLDGTLIVMYWYKGQWRVSTTGFPDARGPVNDKMTFADLFWRTWKELNYQTPSRSDRELTFMFELMTPMNRVIVQHANPRIVLHGIKKVYPWSVPFFGNELWPEQFIRAEEYNWEVARSYPLKNWDEIIEACKQLNPMRGEGFVVVDSYARRVKVKSPQYVALAHAKDGFSDRRMIELVRLNEGSEFLSYFPELQPVHDRYRNLFERLANRLEDDYSRIKSIEVQKDFACEAMKTRMPSVMFSVRKTGQPVRQSLSEMSIHTLEQVLHQLESEI
jgi:hypothetical protein